MQITQDFWRRLLPDETPGGSPTRHLLSEVRALIFLAVPTLWLHLALQCVFFGGNTICTRILVDALQSYKALPLVS